MSGNHTSLLVYGPGLLEYDFGPHHPLRPERITASFDLLTAAGLWNQDVELLAPVPATREELELVHDPEYIRVVEDATSGWHPRAQLAQFGFSSADNPVFPGMHQASACVTGGSVQAVRAIMSGRARHAFNPAGGLHHALRARAAGFCIYNDPAVAAAVALEEFDARVMYVDLDCHHGDGVQWIFYDEPRVLTVSFHETGRYLFPGTGDIYERGEGAGAGYAVNVPFAPFTTDDSWLDALHAIVPPLAERFQPDIIISSHGADTHEWDPLTHLSLSTGAFVEQARLIHQLAHDYADGRWLAVGSGGYDWRRVVPRSWSIVWTEMTGRALPHDLPAGWRARWDTDAGEPLPSTFLDERGTVTSSTRAEETATTNRHTVMRLHEILELQQP